MKRKEKKAFWIGLGTTVAIIFILIGFLSLLFSNRALESQPVQSQDQSKQETSQEDNSKAEDQKDSQQTNQAEEEAPLDETQESDTGGVTHEVESGDTLFSIGLQYDVDWQRIAEVNDLDQDAVLQPGQELIIPSE